ncbi:hypothetical protein COM24_07695 [Bacillus toyonensis]|uniref:hypothetical protein n=1 Tax=Bacillus TaxID=1386 RepID=UPI00033067BD|nr:MULTISPECIES: hypothetical protein [Bacillus cereus group]MEB9420008.1 hypothetical protein [Bacillus cereus]MRC76358.1 hypothetical protein [Bacillus thuringiensis]CUB50828.1 hypothetical protein BN2127_JRS10_00345 [Bacillus subtilis]EOO44495.1 hypothetical protein ICK_06270 [Bacillus cereus BAG1X2-2]MRD18461.1 hypothetical protein [Bacillus thuringiensis]
MHYIAKQPDEDYAIGTLEEGVLFYNMNCFSASRWLLKHTDGNCKMITFEEALSIEAEKRGSGAVEYMLGELGYEKHTAEE